MKTGNMLGILLSLMLVLLSSSCRTKKEHSVSETQTYINEKIESMLSEIKTDYLDMIIKSSLAGDAIIKEKVFDLDKPPNSTGTYPVKIEREIDLNFQKNDSTGIRHDKETKIKENTDINKNKIINTEVDTKKEINGLSWFNTIKNVLLIGMILILLLFLFRYYKKTKP